MGGDRAQPVTLDWEAFCAAIQAVSEAGVPHMIVGSVAATFHGAGRITNDIDVVVAITGQDVERLVEVLEPSFYVDRETAAAAVRDRGMFNAIHYQGGFKIDFYVMGDDEFSSTQFGRRECVTVHDVAACIETAEDTLLSKLKWFSMGHSERQWSDIKEILFANRDTLDMAYVRQWAARLGLTEDLERALKE